MIGVVRIITMNFRLTKYVLGFLETNTFLLQAGNHMLVIDPGYDISMFEKCSATDSVTVLLTHEHFDHITGLNELRRKTQCCVIASEPCSSRIQNVRTNMSAYADVLAELAEKPRSEAFEPFVCDKANIVFDDEYLFDWMGNPVKIVATPGHSAGSCCIVIDDLLFVGDTILDNNLMTRFPGSNNKIYQKKTVPLLKELLGVVNTVYPGHGNTMMPDEALGIICGVK